MSGEVHLETARTATGHHHHGHAHDHAHSHETVQLTPQVRSVHPSASLLRMSIAGRWALAGGVIAAIWAGVFWAVA